MLLDLEESLCNNSETSVASQILKWRGLYNNNNEMSYSRQATGGFYIQKISNYRKTEWSSIKRAGLE
jgi:hypothetical protein